MTPMPLRWMSDSVSGIVWFVTLATVAGCAAGRETEHRVPSACFGSTRIDVAELSIDGVSVGRHIDSIRAVCVVVSDSVRWDDQRVDRSRFAEVLLGGDTAQIAIDARGHVSEIMVDDPRLRTDDGIGPGVSVRDALEKGFTVASVYEGQLRLMSSTSCGVVLWLGAMGVETGESPSLAELQADTTRGAVLRISLRRCMP